MRIAADTNILVRALVEDDKVQSALAQGELARADQVALSTTALCELVWVLARGYRISPGKISHAVKHLIESTNVVFDRPAVEAGLAIMDAGGDFADGVIAYQGRWLGAEIFVSFDKEAVKLLEARGETARLL